MTRAAEGRYECQVSGEGPLFSTVSQQKELRVAVTPKTAPRLENTPPDPLYSIGDWVNLNCSSGDSLPATRLTWFVNRKQAKEHQMVRRFPPEKDDGSGLFTSKLGLQFWIRESHLDHDGKVKVFCMADIPTVYQKRSQEVTIVAADIKDDDDDANREVKNLPVASGVSGVVSEAAQRTFLVQGALTMLHCLRYMAEFMQP